MRGLLAVASLGTGVLLAACGLLATGGAQSQTRSNDRAASLEAWDRVLTVLQHPRCLNCHQSLEPRRGDNRLPHVPRVVRGRDDKGAPGMRCSSCHSAQRNNDASDVPGAARWKMAPRSMAWAVMTVRQICRSLKHSADNDPGSHNGFIKKVWEDSLVQWSWEPGAKREAVPMPHEVFVEFVTEWLRTGAHCPR